MNKSAISRRDMIVGAGAVAAGVAASAARAAQWVPSLGYPDPRVRVLEPTAAGLRTGIAKVEQLATGFNFVEGPVWFGDHRSLVFSDLGANKQMRWDEDSGRISVFRAPSNHTNGATKDRQGRIICCEQLTRRVIRIEHDGAITVIADKFEGKALNSPNDVVVKSDGSIWFTDPPNGITNDYEGRRATQEQAATNIFRVDPKSGAISVAVGDIRPNGLCFSHDETKFYCTIGQAAPNRIMAYDVVADGTKLANPRVLITHPTSTADGIRCDWQGNLWCSWGAGEGESGVRAFAPDGKPLIHIDLPERAANLTFGGPVGSRLFMTAQQSLYSVFVGTRGVKMTD